VSYSHVPAGDYRLRVMAIDHQGTPSEREAVWRFSVAPHWYERWWVGLSAIALTGLLIWGIASVGMARQEVRLKREFSLQLAERTRIAQELHDTLLQTVQSSKMLADEALGQAADPDKVRSAIAQLSEWLGLAVREGRAALNSLRISTADVRDLAEAFRRAADAPTKPTAMTVSVSVHGEPMKLDPLIQHQVYRVGYEAIRNAFAHSAGTRLEIAIEYAHDLILRITDNGVGIAPVVLRRGKSDRFGLHGMNERARTIGATLTIDTSASGTSVTLVVPRRRATET
jgi:signal transduction histidine kinase